MINIFQSVQIILKKDYIIDNNGTKFNLFYNIFNIINTDIKGTVATSLVNEYSLMALALEKKGIEKTEIHQYLKKIMNASHTRKFT